MYKNVVLPTHSTPHCWSHLLCFYHLWNLHQLFILLDGAAQYCSPPSQPMHHRLSVSVNWFLRKYVIESQTQSFLFVEVVFILLSVCRSEIGLMRVRSHLSSWHFFLWTMHHLLYIIPVLVLSVVQGWPISSPLLFKSIILYDIVNRAIVGFMTLAVQRLFEVFPTVERLEVRRWMLTVFQSLENWIWEKNEVKHTFQYFFQMCVAVHPWKLHTLAGGYTIKIPVSVSPSPSMDVLKVSTPRA